MQVSSCSRSNLFTLRPRSWSDNRGEKYEYLLVCMNRVHQVRVMAHGPLLNRFIDYMWLVLLWLSLYIHVVQISVSAINVSFSFGQDALFLLGGLTKATKPVCLSLHSGDVCIMYGDCRLVYHAVPRILPASLESLKHRFNFSSTSDICENKSPKEIDISSQEVCEVKATSRQGVNWELFDQYLQCTRINMNVRQVLPPGGTNIADFPPPVCPSMNCSKEGKK